MTWPVRILADDLTGALDAAAPFATEARPVRLPWRGRALGEGSATASSESRDMGRDAAAAAVREAHARLARGPGAPATWFKKVDSVLRGHPVAETAEMIRAGGFRRCVFAPAFPEMGRVTRGGRQFAPYGAGAPRPVGPDDLRAAFVAEGLDARLGAEPEAEAAQVVLVDAETPEDLARAAARWDGPGVLWAGSRGLAGALAGASPLLRPPPVAAVVVGTVHPATRAQVERVQGRLARPSGPVTLTARRPTLFDPVPEAADAGATRAALAALLAPASPAPGEEACLVVVGGDTLAVALDAFAAEGLDCLGEVEPGVPLSRLRGGRFYGVALVTKSGGFGGPDLLSRLVRSEAEPGG